MPELPDLQVFSRNIEKELAGKILQKLQVSKNARVLPEAGTLLTLEGQQLKKVNREGKELRFHFTKDVLGIHLMLRGKLYWLKAVKQPHTLLRLNFDNAPTLALTDYQYQAAITLNPPESEVPDALSDDVTPAFWKAALQSGAAIKNVLVNQHVIRGIGNAYADEILWRARISPFSIASKIPATAVRSLASAVKKVLKEAETQIDKNAPGIIGGEIRDFLQIHNSKRSHSPAGAVIKHTMSDAKKTYYTDEQKLYN